VRSRRFFNFQQLLGHPLQAALFFAFFILTDPPTSPVKYVDQLVCGAIVAAASFATFELVGAACYLLAGVLVGNVWEAWRRAGRRKWPQRRGLADADGVV
jgi:Na+-translocating ferredoxin:NAD+ oxidoreductase RnfD subunit